MLPCQRHLLVMLFCVFSCQGQFLSDIFTFQAYCAYPDSQITSRHEAKSLKECILLCQRLVTCQAISYRDSTETCLFVEQPLSNADLENNGTFGGNEVSYMRGLVERSADSTKKAPCTDPSIELMDQNSCNVSDSYNVIAALRMSDGKAIIFLDDNTYILCQNMDKIRVELGRTCNPPSPMSDLDPNGYFRDGPPDAAVARIDSSAFASSYFLFKGDMVYQYKTTTAEPLITSCTQGTCWPAKTISERFGAGVPSSPDDVFTQWDYEWNFYFVKGNQIYLTTGDREIATLKDSYPKHIHDVIPQMPCDLTAMMAGQNSGEYIYFKQSNILYNQNNQLVGKGTMCAV